MFNENALKKESKRKINSQQRNPNIFIVNS